MGKGGGGRLDVGVPNPIDTYFAGLPRLRINVTLRSISLQLVFTSNKDRPSCGTSDNKQYGIGIGVGIGIVDMLALSGRLS